MFKSPENEPRFSLPWEKTLLMSIRMHAYGIANLVQMAVLETCFLTFPLNSQKLYFKTNSVILVISSVEIFLFTRLSNAFLKVSRPASWRIPGSRPTTPCYNNSNCAIWLIFFNFVVKPLDFSVGLPQFEINDLPGTSDKHLWNLGSR